MPLKNYWLILPAFLAWSVSMTHSYSGIFAVVAVLALATLAYGWWGIRQDSRSGRLGSAPLQHWLRP